MKTKLTINVAAFLVAFLTDAEQVSSQTPIHDYVVIDLGARCVGCGSGASAINASGQVVGTADSFTGPRHAFLYSNGSILDLGTLGGGESWAYGINASGQVVGWSGSTSFFQHAFLYSNGSMQDIGTLWYQSEARGINSIGQIVGSYHQGGRDY